MNHTIFDVGAHKGEDSDFYLKLGYRVVGVEAHPALADNLRKKFADQIRDGRYALVDKAIAASDGKITFYVNKKVSVWGTIDPGWAARNNEMGADSEAITVPSIRFAEILKEYGCPHYLKVDVEGADGLCVKALFDVEKRPKYLSIESSKTSWTHLLTEFDMLEKLGYSKFKVVDQRRHVGGKFKDVNGRLIEHEFSEGATGPFGEALEGAWLSKKEAIRRYVPIFFLYKTLGDNTLLSKILQPIPLVRRVLGLVSWYDTHAMRD